MRLDRQQVEATLRRRESERTFLDAVIQLATLRGWLTYHTWRSDHSAKGFPDLIAVRDGCLLAIEVKRESGVLSAAQQDWLRAFQAIPGCQAFCWRPSDWEQIERTLT